MNNEQGYDDYNVFIRQSVRQLLEDRMCYCYNNSHIRDIKKRLLDKYKLEASIEKNECGYTLYLPKKIITRKEKKDV